MNCIGGRSKKGKTPKRNEHSDAEPGLDANVTSPLLASANFDIENERTIDLKNEITELFKEIDDLKINDHEIINKLDGYLAENSIAKRRVQLALTSYDNISVLHAAARACRSELCVFLIETYDCGII
jgi:hypothetical protein